MKDVRCIAYHPQVSTMKVHKVHLLQQSWGNPTQCLLRYSQHKPPRLLSLEN